MDSRNMKWLGKWIIVVTACVLTGPAWAAHPFQEWADEFGIDLNASYDGTRVMEMKEGTFEFVEHKAPGKMYTLVQMGNMTSGVLIREDLGKGFLLMPSMGMYRETSLEDGLLQNSNGMKFQSIEKVGEDEILGFDSTKFKTRFEDNDGKGSGHFWVTEDGVPIKMDMVYTSSDVEGMHMTMEFIELNMREQDPAIFELPSNLKPMGLSGFGSIFSDSQAGGDSGAGTAALGDAFKNMTPEQRKALSDAGLDGIIPGVSGQQQTASAQGATAPTESNSRKLTTDNMTQSVQLHLQHLGIDPGDTSGELTLETQIAISQFQASKGLKITGEVSPQLLGILSAEVDNGQ